MLFQTSRWVLVILSLLRSSLTFDSNNSNEQQALLRKVLRSLNEYPDFIDSKEVTDEIIGKTIQYSNRNKTEPDDTGLARRSGGGETAWICESEVIWKDLGNLYYPRFVKEVHCLGRPCMYGYYSCLPQNYTVRVLSVKQNGDDYEITLPRPLREDWKLVDIQISVACVCMN